MVLAVLLCAAEYTFAAYQKKRIPERYYYDMMADITRWTENGRAEFGVPGFSEIGWARNYITMHLFQLGRLQFQFSKVNLRGKLSRQELEELPFPNGSPSLYIHIPKARRWIVRRAWIRSGRRRSFSQTITLSFHSKALQRIPGCWIQLKNVVARLLPHPAISGAF